jgi:hypothetical protein
MHKILRYVFRQPSNLERTHKNTTDGLKIKDIYWLIGRDFKLSLENNILLYKTIIKPIWTYGVEIWGCASKSNISIIQRCQSKILRMSANAPWHVLYNTS